eukprot:34705-Eustigmatos_ZCMA.PRE.1
MKSVFPVPPFGARRFVQITSPDTLPVTVAPPEIVALDSVVAPALKVFETVVAPAMDVVPPTVSELDSDVAPVTLR